MRQVGGDTGGVDHIVESELANEGGELQEQRQRLRGIASVAGCLQVRSESRQTCPIPPEAPATTVDDVRANLRGNVALCRVLTSLDHFDCGMKVLGVT